MPKPTHRTPSDKAKARWGNKARPPGPQRKGWSPWKGTLADALPPTASRKDVFHCETMLQAKGYDTLREGVTRLIERDAKHVKILDAANLAFRRAGFANADLAGAIETLAKARDNAFETLHESHEKIRAAGMDFSRIPDAITHLIETKAEANAGLDAIGQAAFKLSENSHNFSVQSIIAKIEMMRLDGQKLQTKLDAKAGHPRPEDLARVEGYAKELEARIKNQASTIRDLQERLNALTAPVVTINTTFKPEDKAALEQVMEEVARRITPAGAKRPEPRMIAKNALTMLVNIPDAPEDIKERCNHTLGAIRTNLTDSKEDLEECLKTLDIVARHGNGARWGNSNANVIAQEAMKAIWELCPDLLQTTGKPGTATPAPARVKPPLGLVPRKIRRAQRLGEILEACARHLEHYGSSQPMPAEWVLELDELNHETANDEQ